MLTKEQIKELEESAKPLMKFLAENFHPHVKIIVESNSAEFVEGQATVKCDDFIVD
jgi:ABC-type phosphate/phosphonate transport system substrate-binding protein